MTQPETTSPSAVVDLSAITRTYLNGDVQVPVLRGIDLRVDHGEYVAIMGRSGSGKSTLMNILGCLDRPTSGRYLLDGQDVSALDDDTLSRVRGRTIGFVFQSFHLLKDRDVCENVELPMTYQGVEPKARRARAVELLERVGLGHRLDHRPGQLSGGERQRVAIARSLANRPRVLLADEPTGNLDSGARGRILELFEALREEEALTLIMVTHDELIGELAGRRIIIADGRVLDDGRGTR